MYTCTVYTKWGVLLDNFIYTFPIFKSVNDMKKVECLLLEYETMSAIK